MNAFYLQFVVKEVEWHICLKVTSDINRALNDVMHRIEITILGVNLIYRNIKGAD